MIVRAARVGIVGARAVRRVARPPLPRQLEHGAAVEVVDHLGEFRSRLIVVLSVVVSAFALAFVYHGAILQWLNDSLPASVGDPVTLGVAEPFMTSIKISAWAAFAAAFPVIIWQVWGFVAPVFDAKARRSALIFLMVGTALFSAGVAFAYLVALPAAISFLTSYDAHLYDVQLRAREFYSFAAAVLISVGLVFELPIVLLGLMRFRVLPSERLRGNRGRCYVALTGLAVLLPGVDPVMTLMQMVPLAVLFEATLIVGRLFERRWAAAPLEPDAAA